MAEPVDTTSVAALVNDKVLASLRADPALQTLFAGDVRAWDNAPNAGPYPHIVLGELQGIPEVADGYRGDDVVLTLHVWDQPDPPSLGKRRCIAIADAAEACLLDLEITVPFHRLVEASPEGSLHINDAPNGGLIKHSIVNIRWLTEPIPPGA